MSVKYSNANRCGGMVFDGYGDNYILLGMSHCDSWFYTFDEPVDLYTTDLKLVLNDVAVKSINMVDNYLFFRDNNVVHKYDNKGNEINKYQFNKLLDQFDRFFVVVENDSLLLKDDKNFSIVLGEWKDSYKYHEPLYDCYISNGKMFGHYFFDYNDNRLFYNRTDKEVGIYLDIETNKNSETSGIGYFFNINTQKVKKYDVSQFDWTQN